MKNLFRLFTVAALCVVATTTASAQIYYGVKAGANVTTVSAVDGLGDATSQYGYQAGVNLGVKVPIVGIGVEAEALYVNNKLSFSDGCDVNSHSFEIPVMLVVPPIPMVPLYIKAGPSFIVAQSATSVSADGTKSDLDPVKSTVGYTVGLGLKVLKFTLDVRFNGQFTGATPFESLNIENAAATYGDIKTNTISASLGYRF